MPGELSRVVRAAHRLRHQSVGSGDQTASNSFSLRDVILGGQDGLVNILGIVLGVIAGGGSRTVLLSADFAASITESISMGAVGYTSTLAERDYYRAQRANEAAAIEARPEDEQEEIRAVYAERGFSGELLDQVVETITANRNRWLGSLMDDKLHLQPVSTRAALRSAGIITLATLIGHLLPLAPFLWLPRTQCARRTISYTRFGPIRTAVSEFSYTPEGAVAAAGVR